MDIMNEETFGPVIPVMKVGSDDEAIRLMNDSEYGLTASIWTKDVAKGEELAEEVEAGTVFVNRCDFPSPVLIFSILFHCSPSDGLFLGSCMDWLENIWQRCYAEQIRFRAIRQVKELPCQELSEMMYLFL